jgi:hypothetical protein
MAEKAKGCPVLPSTVNCNLVDWRGVLIYKISCKSKRAFNFLLLSLDNLDVILLPGILGCSFNCRLISKLLLSCFAKQFFRRFFGGIHLLNF